jgi:hypothetical protein
VWLGSSELVFFPVPHATRERSTATRQSSPCRRRCASDRPSVVGSWVFGLPRAVVLRDGARFTFCDFGAGAVPADSVFFWAATPSWVLLLSFVMTLTRLARCQD